MSTKRPILVKYLKDSRGGQLQVWQLYPMLGLKPSHPIPPDFTMETEIQGVKIIIKKAAKRDGVFKFKHRIYAVCPDCGKEIPFGRMQQHSPIHATTFQKDDVVAHRTRHHGIEMVVVQSVDGEIQTYEPSRQFGTAMPWFSPKDLKKVESK